MNAWQKFKSMGWVAALGVILSAVLLAMSGLKASRRQRRADILEEKLETFAHDRTKHGIEKAEKLQRKKDAHLGKAKAARERMEKQLENIGESNNELDAIADRFNSRRLRKSAGGAS